MKVTVNHLALGGTFDHFHKGHREFLNQAFRKAHRVTIGITTDRFARSLHADATLEPFASRQQAVEGFLVELGVSQRGEIVVLHDVFGTTLQDANIEALLVTRRTMAGARLINHERRKQGKPLLQISKVPLTRAEDGRAISSGRIRNGEISREGVVFRQRLLEATPLQLPETLRRSFRDPFGEVIATQKRSPQQVMRAAKDLIAAKKLSPTIVVGDVVARQALRLGLDPKIVVVDLLVSRQRRFASIAEIGDFRGFRRTRLANPPGKISQALARSLATAIERSARSLIQVDGEEDLAVLPAVLLAPLASAVVYGHFQFGVIVVAVTEAKKTEALQLLQQLQRFSLDS